MSGIVVGNGHMEKEWGASVGHSTTRVGVGQGLVIYSCLGMSVSHYKLFNKLVLG